jgi:class 3 adenylate cyclase
MALAQNTDPEHLSVAMNALWARLDVLIRAHGGTIDKHTGDGVMALFGTQTAGDDDPEQAVRAALAMQQEMKKLRLDGSDFHPSVRESITSLGLRVGINTGPVLLGPLGTTLEYTALGEAVNLASRLEEAAPVGGILISDATFRHVQRRFGLQTLEPIRVKGKAEPVQVYLVRESERRARRLPTQDVKATETRTVDRDVKLACSLKALAIVSEERLPTVVTTVGEAGVAQTHLPHAFANGVDSSTKSVVYSRGRASPQDSGLPPCLIRTCHDITCFLAAATASSTPTSKVGPSVKLIKRGPVVFLLEHWSPNGSPDLIERLTQANRPLSIVELIEMLTAAGVSVQGKECCFAVRKCLAGSRVPPTLDRVFSAGLDGLPCALVMGRMFLAGPVGWLNGGPGTRNGRAAGVRKLSQSKELLSKKEIWRLRENGG